MQLIQTQKKADTAAQAFWRSFITLGALLLGGVALPVAQAVPAVDHIWIEGEATTSITPNDFKPEITSVGQPTYLSGGNWLHIYAKKEDVQKQVPTNGITLTYRFTAPKAANYEIWNRIGYENSRSPFDWRVDGGGWSTVTSGEPTTDVEELQTWNPIGWMKLANRQLANGAHTLEVRLLPNKNEKGEYNDLQYASDAFCLSAGPFHPDGPLHPGDTTWQTATDKAAAAQTFSVAAPQNVAQTAISLKGNWQYASWDEMTVNDRTGPIKEMPSAEDLTWHAIPVPSNRNESLPEKTYVHRYFLRTRINVPAALDGHSFLLRFPALNMLATVFVNGQQCGFENTPIALFECDITKAVRPGQTNEIWVGLKDAFYGMANKENATHIQYLPYDFWHYNATNQLDFPVLGRYETGILNEPFLVVAGKAYTSDVFAMPSVKNKSLGLEVTVMNPTNQAATVQMQNEVVPLSGGAAAKTFAPKEVQVPAGQNATVRLSEGWANPKLWWPDDPQQYNVVTRLSLNGQMVDERRTKFGFREWDWQGPQFKLNGIPWHGRADLYNYGKADAASMKAWREHGMTMERMWGNSIEWGGMEPDKALDFYDANGMPIRRTGIFDGEGAAGFYNTDSSNTKLYDNWRAQLAAWVRGQRNHPSIFIWSMENEITFINGHVTGHDKDTTREMKAAADMLAHIDPTRPQMVDGGNALLDESLPVYGGHYMQPAMNDLPEGAYDKPSFAHRQVWPITQLKPILFGEDFFASGVELSDFATVAGESAFVGKSEARPAIGLTARMLSEGYRWNGINFHFWFGGETDLHYIAWQPIAVLCRQWDWTFGSGQKVTRTFGIFNDTRFDQPIAFIWTLNIGGKKVAGKTTTYNVGAGLDKKFDEIITMPTVTSRQEGELVLTLAVNGKPVFKDVKALSLLNTGVIAPMGKGMSAQGETTTKLAAAPLAAITQVNGEMSPRLAKATAKPAARATTPVNRVANTGLSAQGLAVYDPKGVVGAFLHARAMPFTAINSLNALPAGAKVLVIGPDALTPAESTSSSLAAYASGGKVVIILEQTNSLKYQGLPGQMQSDTAQGYIAFAEDLDNPILKNLRQKDFFSWGPDGLVYKNAYVKPTSGGRSLVQCDKGLQDTALAQMQAGNGVILLSQLVVGQKLATSPVAQQLLLNMLAYGAGYKLTFKPVTVVAGDNTQLVKALDATGLQYTKATDVLQAISKPGTTAIISANPANLKTLAANAAKVNAFTAGGGWIIFNNLTPEGLADYNQVVGFDHMIRPFKQEKVSFPAVRNPLTAGLATSNIVIGSGKPIFSFAAGQYPDPEAFSYVVDYDEVAPFAKSTFSNWDNITNNYTMQDGFWPLIINFPIPAGNKPYDIPITLPKPQTITQFTWVSDTNYWGTKQVNLIFNGQDKLSFNTEPNGETQTFPVTPPRTTRELVLQPAVWEPKQGSNPLMGIDNIYLKAQRPKDFYQKVKPMLNIGAMMEYPRGNGGLVLCNVRYKDSEAVPENATKKQTILATILRNLQAPFTGGKSIIAGAGNLAYAPVDISKHANQFRTERGWFGDKNFTFTDLPTGKHTFASVPYDVYEFTTSPVPTTIMLGGGGIPGNLPEQVTGIPVNRKADALFFLQTARIDARRNEREVKEGKQYEMADYVVHYADGQTVKVPIYAEINVDNYKQKAPATAIPGAQIAWSAPYAGTDQTAVAYSMQWNNPRPEVAISTIDLIYGPERRGVPALLAITVANAR